MESSTRRSSNAPANSTKPSTRSTIGKSKPATAPKSSTCSSIIKKLSPRLTTAMKPSPRRCMIPHISRNCLTPVMSSVCAEIAASKPSQDYMFEFDDWDMPEENEPWLLPEEVESSLQTAVHKLSSEGMTMMVTKEEADNNENHILDSTNKELSVTAMSVLLNVPEEDIPKLQTTFLKKSSEVMTKILVQDESCLKKSSEVMTKILVQDEACNWKNSKLFKIFDAFSKSERHKLYPTVVSPPKDREPLLYDFFDYNYYFEDDDSKATDGGANSIPPR